MKFTLVTILLILIFSQLKSQKVNEYNLSAQIKTCDTETVLLTMIRSNRTRPLFRDITKIYNLENHEFLKNRNTAFINLSHQFANLSKKQKKLVINTIHNWCAANKYLDKLETGDAAFPAVAILYNNSYTRKLFNKFIVNKDQDWDSLSSYESYELNLSYLAFIDGLNPKEKGVVYKSLMSTKKAGRKH